MKTRVSVRKIYTITFTAYPTVHTLFYATIRHFLATSKSIGDDQIIEIKIDHGEEVSK